MSIEVCTVLEKSAKRRYSSVTLKVTMLTKFDVLRVSKSYLNMVCCWHAVIARNYIEETEVQRVWMQWV